jgi:predicted Rossmann fold flavoprotein
VGGKTYPATGSTGDGYRLAKSLGHTIVEPVAALAPVRVRDYPFAECAGLSFENVMVKLFRNGKKIASNIGDLLLTHHGMSGPVILDMSRNIRPNDEVRVSFITGFADAATLEKKLMQDTSTFGKKSVKNLLAKYGVPERLLTLLFTQSNISLDLTAAELSRETRKTLAWLLIELPFPVEKLGGNNEAMVTRGGVSLSEVNRNTMQSRIVPGLFFCGELLDIDGDTGGYNLQFAFSSGKLAADVMVVESGKK